MKKTSLIILGILVAMSLVVAVAFAGPTTMKLKVGDEVYACNCGAKCPCQTMSRKAGKCTCAHDMMVKAKVMKVEKDMVLLQAKGWAKPLPFKTVGKYACACGPTCKCDTISQKPGKCPCGKEMMEVKPMKKAG